MDSEIAFSTSFQPFQASAPEKVPESTTPPAMAVALDNKSKAMKQKQDMRYLYQQRISKSV